MTEANLLSTAPVAHLWLRVNLAAATGLTTFNRVLTGTNVPDNFLVVGAITKLGQDWAGLGNGRRDETYDIGLLLRVYTGDSPTALDVEALFNTAHAYAQQVVSAVSNPDGGDSTLGGAVIYSQVSSIDELEPSTPAAGGLEVGIEITLSCRAQVYK